MGADGVELSIEQLADQTGVSVRTVRYYISQGLLAGPGARGRSAAYGEEHLARLRLIRRLAEQHVPLAEQRRRLEGLSYAEVRALLGQEERRERAMQQAEAGKSPRDYVAELLARARAARSDESQRQSPLASSADVLPAPPPSARAMPLLARRRLVAPLSAQPEPSGEQWLKWQLAPGIELHARVEVARTQRELIERLVETARAHATFTQGGNTE